MKNIKTYSGREILRDIAVSNNLAIQNIENKIEGLEEKIGTEKGMDIRGIALKNDISIQEIEERIDSIESEIWGTRGIRERIENIGYEIKRARRERISGIIEMG